MNALQTLISETMAAKGLRKSQIVSLLGFKNITKGIRRLDAFVEDGVDSPGMLDRLPSALGSPPRQCTPLMSRRSTRCGPRLRRNAPLIWTGSEANSSHTSGFGRNAPARPYFRCSNDRWTGTLAAGQRAKGNPALLEPDQLEQVVEIIRQHHTEQGEGPDLSGRSPATTTGPSSSER